MTDTWQHHLKSLGATLTDGFVQHFGDPVNELTAAENSTILADLSHLGLIQVSGTDALTYLQGQLTQDVEKITEERAAFAGHCSPKGRLLAHFLAWKSDDRYFLQLPRELIECVGWAEARSPTEVNGFPREIVGLPPSAQPTITSESA